ncbi:sterol desaturase/sphingolipid hydroxylase (fatty acid hydroxylase superfamily) [Novosphingobium sp. GV055]|nr:sterol desaturase/sphingolipid hydroxylase (fatty acid hydroxylase superfamily) [Novosphingobium sp. GV055]PUB07546.1 sterol desaturase/sphingolipid hydroxylase (fatty acid hydroxylase superfamily) [Novosphingobium sp. GV061]PUB23359.1 sterol desaturase/sphingolipid hydroxylase (fatty acid hydroxylase superfamily) [Novosphingobium sp. GV079]PUB45123.1 sterol desaturase/sphingolipid hydroxylase (fatty acid hydroxylase superfamily) [Novosphingobium sp. GV027]
MDGTDMKQRLIGLIPPATLLAVILFWAYAPKSVIDYPWTLTIVATAISAWLLLLEWLFERHADWRMNWREFFTDTFYVVLSSTVISRATDFFADAPMKAAKASAGLATPWLEHLPFLAQVGLIFFLFEFGQYWMHRAMHNWTPLWLTHAPHHHITQLNALKGYVGNPLELFLISLGVITLLDFSPVAILCAASVGNVVAGFAHANVKSDPPWFYSFFFTTIRHHSLHHSVGYEETRCNYANSMILIDRVLGTYREGEGILVGQDERRRLTIREQFMFPFVPVIDAIKQRRAGNEEAVQR